MPGLVPTEELTPGDLVGTNKDSYLILEKLPAEYDNRVKAMEVDEKPTEEYSDIGGELMSSGVAVVVVWSGSKAYRKVSVVVFLLMSVELWLQSASLRVLTASKERCPSASVGFCSY